MADGANGRGRRREPGYRPRGERVRDYREVELRLSDEEAVEQARRCMDCGTPFCHGCGCPLGNLCPEVAELVRQRRWKDAVDALLAANPFPELTGRVCPALCEAACVRGLHEGAVTIRHLELAVVEKGFEKGYIAPVCPAVRRSERVAIVGSGPAGLAAADALNRAGYRVVVFESAARPGGILRYGIPDFKLDKRVLDRRIRLMEAEGIVFESGVRIGTDMSGEFLAGRHDAVCLAGGAREPRDLRVPGRELGGVHFAMDFLVQQNRRVAGEAVGADEAIEATGRRVLIVGGGDTGSDCLGTALRQRAASACQCEIMPEPPAQRAESTPWPAWPLVRRASSSHDEGGERRWGVTVKALEGRAGRVERARMVAVDWVSPAAGGAAAPAERAGSEFVLDADLVLIAMGFSGPGRSALAGGLGLETDAAGRVMRDGRRMTSRPGVFVAGDTALGASLVVRAIADGRAAAAGIMEWLGERHGEAEW